MSQAVYQQIKELREQIDLHNYEYYTLDRPTISDFEFDKKLKKLQELENQYPEYFDENSPTQRVGGAITKNFETVVHEHRMYSLENSYSKEDLIDWENRIQKILGDVPIEYACELNTTGLPSASLMKMENSFGQSRAAMVFRETMLPQT